MRSLFAAVTLSACALLGFGQTAFAGSNWMREYVDLRVQARAERALGEPLVVIGPTIVGGAIADPASNRFQVGLLFKAQPDNFLAQYCGGTLVASRYVVTAAHCSDFVTAAQVQVLTGTRRLDGSGVRRNVDRVWIHPAWNDVTFDFDVAVWRLTTPAQGPYALLTNVDPPNGTPLLATGWGSLIESPSTYPIDLRQVIVPLFPRGDCNDANSYNGEITARMLCAGFTAGGKDTCQGDSGGPITDYPPGVIGYYRLVGITSWGVGCARANLPGVYTRVSNPSILNFILTKLP